jgi:hypothetical protein
MVPADLPEGRAREDADARVVEETIGQLGAVEAGRPMSGKT